VSKDEAAFREAVRRRDPAAWARLEREHGATLYRLAARILPESQDPENAVGEVWLKALSRAHRYDPERSPFPWLARICSHVCLTQGWRSRFLRRWMARHPAERPERGGAETSHARESLREALQSLPSREREIVTLRFLFEVSPGEIARLLGVERGTVDRTLFRGLERLRGKAGSGVDTEWAALEGRRG
jgi:RNA polymerase sigma-70 factor (ECF subfamily)